jgi:hypothetical protein
MKNMRDLEVLLLALVIIFIVLLLVRGQRPANHADDLSKEEGHHGNNDERV